MRQIVVVIGIIGIIAVVGISFLTEFGAGIVASTIGDPVEFPHYRIAKLKDKSVIDKSKGFDITVRKISIVILTDPDYSETQIEILFRHVSDYYTNVALYNVVWMEVLPDIIYEGSACDSLQRKYGPEFFMSIARGVRISGWVPKPESMFVSSYTDCGNGLMVEMGRQAFRLLEEDGITVLKPRFQVAGRQKP